MALLLAIWTARLNFKLTSPSPTPNYLDGFLLCLSMVKLCSAISSIFNEYQLTFLPGFFQEHTLFVTHPRKNCFSSVFQLLLRFSRQLVVWVYECELFSSTCLTSWNPVLRCLDLLVLLKSCVCWLKLTFVNVWKVSYSAFQSVQVLKAGCERFVNGRADACREVKRCQNWLDFCMWVSLVASLGLSLVFDVTRRC